MPRKGSIVGLGLALWASTAWAQVGAIEVTPLLGSLSDANVGAERGSFGNFGPSGGFAWGGALGYNFGASTGIELQWTRQNGDLEADGVARASMTQDLVHVQFLMLIGNPYARVRPYVLGGGGVGSMRPRRADMDEANRFSLVLGGGLKAYVTDFLGVRAQARYVATHVGDPSQGYFCSDGAGCLYVSQSAFLHQGEYTFGLVLRY